MIAAPGLDVPFELRARLADLYCAYTDVLDEGELERWPDFFTEDCLYKVLPRENFEQALPIALIYCESRNMLADRVVALRETVLFVPRTMRHLTGKYPAAGDRTERAAPDRQLCACADDDRPALRNLPVRQVSRPVVDDRGDCALPREFRLDDDRPDPPIYPV